MQSIIIFIILSIIASILMSNFINLTANKKCKNFNFKEYIDNFKLSHIDIKYIFIFFILFEVVIKEESLESILVLVPLCFSLILAFILDIKYMIIPDTSSIAILFSGVVNLVFNFSKENLVNNVFGLIIGGFTLFIIDFIFEKITKSEGFGYGDMKLLGAIGFLFGYKSVIVIMILSIIISSIFGVIYLIINKVKNIKDAYLPFGPFIVISTFIICIVPATLLIEKYFAIVDNLVNKMI